MKQELLILAAAAVIGASLYWYTGQQSCTIAAGYATPQQAAEQIFDGEWSIPMQEVIHTYVNEKGTSAFVFFYSQMNEPHDYLGIAQASKTDEGWVISDVSGAGHLNPANTGNETISFENPAVLTGLAPDGAASVRSKDTAAQMIELPGKPVNIWYVPESDSKNAAEGRYRFYDANDDPIH
ncbi:hypothetical protein [Bacillus marinisedimentorum]|uniref:hypothetical protein n=1 Tax=Bacillus marinisedimentorum TaxID=1821260 RepID=UPI0008721E00|nr:hypothetical protein [Bacillus marinisedimentorum]